MKARALAKGLFVIMALCCNITSSCGSREYHQPLIADTIPAAGIPVIRGSFSTQSFIHFDSSVIKNFLDSFPLYRKYEKELLHFYRERKFAYAWFDENGLIETAANLYNRIINITEEGLPDKVLYKTELSEKIENASNADPFTELMLTCQYLDYASQAWKGLNENIQSTQWLLPRKKLSYHDLLDSISNNILEKEPVYPQYQLLKTALKQLSALQQTQMLPFIKTGAKKITPGNQDTAVSIIRHWLWMTGDITADNNSNIYDTTLVTAVKQFQQRTGLKEDGIITSAVINEMNIPIQQRIETIMVNMERCRWIPSNPGNRYVLINIPDFRLFVIENDSVVLSMKVVTGKPQHKTVIFNGNLQYIVFSPYWNVPASILKNEILPAIRKNKNYLSAHNMEWYGTGVRQKPGPDNSLGLVKFLFPNSHNIYLHDTPAKSLFNESSRAFSHGCIRIAEPKKLAIYLLKNDREWNESSIDSAMHAGKERTITLSAPIPVYITYFTAWVNRKGKLQFRKDIYGRDRRLAGLLMDKTSR